MSGMSTLVLLTSSPQVVARSRSDASQTTGESNFSKLLGQFVSEEAAVAQGEVSNEDLLMKLLAHFNFSEEELNDKDELKELLYVLPIEQQEEMMAFVQEDEPDLHMVFTWPPIQQVVLVLMNALADQSPKLDDHLYKFATAFTEWNVVESDLTEDLVMKFKQLVDQKKAEGQLVLNLTMNNETDKATQQAKLPLFHENSLSQGLHVSQTGQELGQAMSKVEQAVIHIGDRLPKEMQQQQFLRQLQTLIQRSVLSQSPSGMNTLSIKLFPAHLGRLDIQLTQIDGVITARILTGSTTARDLIEAQLTQLRQAFNQQQIQVEKIEIAHHYLGQEKEEESSGRNTKEDEALQEESKQESESDFQVLLEEALFNEQV
ncbi:flagellar hook-length control protein FliK [Halalkalibacter alkalisediminis]|uniref:Flagellar hook-length control protein FliK n=1 Tax=Halalkalibacter alkalisediminis TaxID=935616 RepID=A0ABV6NCV3_9BACI|nr:flagellar hook-length control protein FliK [Halalkalibacter alkalisediminis]